MTEFRQFDHLGAREIRDTAQDVYARAYMEAIASGEPPIRRPTVRLRQVAAIFLAGLAYIRPSDPLQNDTPRTHDDSSAETENCQGTLRVLMGKIDMKVQAAKETGYGAF